MCAPGRAYVRVLVWWRGVCREWGFGAQLELEQWQGKGLGPSGWDPSLDMMRCTTAHGEDDVRRVPGGRGTGLVLLALGTGILQVRTAFWFGITTYSKLPSTVPVHGVLVS